MIHHVYANQSNIGDWLSARGIQSLIAPQTVTEHFCDEPFVPETLAALSRTGPEDFILIGGGGLFMDYFVPFWEGFQSIARRTPFAVWGAGCCDMKREHSRPPVALISGILKRARLCVVRDELTRSFLSPLTLPPPVACPTLNAVPTQGGEQKCLLHVDHYDNVGMEIYDRMVAVAQDFAARTERRLRQTNNLIPSGQVGALQGTLNLYAAADLVLTSRLHSCIIALAMGRRVLVVSGDRKVESFMSAAGLGDWVCDLNDIDSLSDRLDRLPEQPLPTGFITDQRQHNVAVAAKIQALLAHSSSGSLRA